MKQMETKFPRDFETWKKLVHRPDKLTDSGELVPQDVHLID